MRIDSTQRTWAIASAIIFTAALIVYIVYTHNSIEGARGGSAASPLPADGPAAALVAEVVGALPRHVDSLGGLRKGQRPLVVLQEDE